MDGYTQHMAPRGPDQESASRMMEEMAPAKATDEGGWKVESVNIKRTENGGFIVTCSKTKEMARGGGGGNMPQPSRDYQSKDYAFTSFPEAMSYVASEFGEQAEPEPEMGAEMMA